MINLCPLLLPSPGVQADKIGRKFVVWSGVPNYCIDYELNWNRTRKLECEPKSKGAESEEEHGLHSHNFSSSECE